MDWNATTNNASASDAPTVEGILKAVAEFRERFPPPDRPPEHIVMTNECWEALRRHTEDQGHQSAMGPFGHLLGIPVEHFPTEAECVMRAIELFLERRLRVAIVAAKPIFLDE